MGMKNSKVGWFSFVGGVTGYTSGMLMIWLLNAVDYPILVGGKPMFSPFAAFPPSYELTILFGAFGAIFGMLFLNRLPRLHHPLLKHGRFAKASHDKFFVVIETGDPRYSETETRKLLENAIQTLPEGQRVMVVMYHSQGLSYEEIAEITQLPMGTVKSRLNRARLALRDRLAPVAELFSAE